MIAKRIVPCLDVNNGRVVKGTNFVNLKDAGDPVELALLYNEQGADELVFLDITASSDKRAILIDLVEKVAQALFIPFTVGGGINDCETIRSLLNAGADKVSINTAAITQPELVLSASQRFGSQCIVVAIDARKVQSKPAPPPKIIQETILSYPDAKLTLDNNSNWEVYTHGGRNRTGLDAVKWAEFMEKKGAGELLVTSMDADGTKAGYDLKLMEAISNTTRLPLIASGGAGTLDHIIDALKICEAALLASLLHYKTVSISDIKQACQNKHITIRPTPKLTQP